VWLASQQWDVVSSGITSSYACSRCRAGLSRRRSGSSNTSARPRRTCAVDPATFPCTSSDRRRHVREPANPHARHAHSALRVWGWHPVRSPYLPRTISLLMC